MCGKLASYGRYHDNRNTAMEKLPKYNIVKLHFVLYVMKEIFYSFRTIIMSLLYSQSKDTEKTLILEHLRVGAPKKWGQK